jgi:iron-sulfur cluster repair protein YtfE (RIC family)
MNAIDLLKRDHQVIGGLFNRLQGVPGKPSDAFQAGDRTGLLSQLKYELDSHADIEEGIFYPMFKDRPETRDIVSMSLDQHAEIKRRLNEICNLQPSSDTYVSKLTMLRRDVQQHINQEESVLFPKVQKLLSAAEFDALGAKLQQAKLTLDKTSRPQGAAQRVPAAAKSREATRPAMH